MKEESKKEEMPLSRDYVEDSVQGNPEGEQYCEEVMQDVPYHSKEHHQKIFKIDKSSKKIKKPK
jgi:hypothetical protein